MLYSDNVAYLEDLVRNYLRDPASVDPSWRAWFEGPGREMVDAIAPAEGPSQKPGSLYAPKNGHAAPKNGQATGASPDVDVLKAQARISQLINAFRVRGHLRAKLDPLGFLAPVMHPELDPAHWGLSEKDQDRVFSTAPLYGPQTMTLRDLHAWLLDTYSRTIGAEFMYIHDVEIKQWFQERFERTRNRSEFDRETQCFLYAQLRKAELFEDFIHTKFRGAKRFSLEGGESLLPILALIVETSARHGVEEIVFGMAHRGRLNVLANVLGKDPAKIFAEFQDNNPEAMLGRGDVKYHMGYESIMKTRFGDEVRLAMAFNPSHLEFINPVVEGKVRATQDRMNALGEDGTKKVLPLLIHGDAAFIGQGIVSETLNLAGVDGYSTGGTIHIVVNNQIGFTTEPRDSRSAHYCTEIAKMIQAPIIHVNGEDPEAVAHVARIAAEFRQTFKRDIVIDLYCYRKYGHNEGDEPTFTQPLMYKAIAQHPPVHAIYRKNLMARGAISEQEVNAIEESERSKLEAQLETAKTTKKGGIEPFGGRWAPYLGGPDASVSEGATAIDEATFDKVIRQLVAVPNGFHINPKVQKLLEKRLEVLDPNTPIDWGLGEMIAYGSLVMGGAPVRITGQDVTRGTFSHRHAGFFDMDTGALHMPLHHAGPGAGFFSLHNSVLSEAAVLGFEYGYALEAPEALVVWEAQFGDFANGAQVIIDQFISAGEDKWNRLSAVTLLLPHGFEGQGPEHSSARLERFLQLAGEDNMQICNLTTPAQVFHALRRQVVRPWRKPLVVMSPKSLLRHKLAVSHRADFTSGGFQRVIGEAKLADPSLVDRAIICSGKVYYDLLERREATGDSGTAIIRLEQLYPFPEARLLESLAAFPQLREVIWCQEEPSNMGAQIFLHPLFTRLFGHGGTRPVGLRWVARAESASPATGSPKAHAMEQQDLLSRAFAR
jgi:2-oxoglutarate dehydrogenase E1 component